ncbi:hypothetical protein [Rossellomorea aquimaris]|uniref:Uncharacterized protein n=1 Tax=Rossellomorea aquimaris TaxID=189382 RepID=A0A5D4UNG5_9BACI|nr:hypothetical protein [Rossellomorea aquimaris]TYS88329.1 hypothetical protein FZC85_02500 [Rossellomorea aquimaris]
MERKSVVKELITIFSKYHKKHESFKEFCLENPVLEKSIEVFDEELEDLIYLNLKQLGICENDETEQYCKENWTINTCYNLIKLASEDDKYVKAAIDIVSDWENLKTYTSKVESHTWFYYKDVLVEHS